MKVPRLLAAVAIVVILAAGIWWLFPGCRYRAKKMADKYGGWTEEARRSDPVGFIDYAAKKLGDHVAQLKNVRSELADARRMIGRKIAETTELSEKARSLADGFRRAYREAEAGGGYPVELSGAEYSREQLIEQVRVILMQRRNYTDILRELQAADATAKQKEQKLVVQVNNTQAALSTLPSKREIARIDELTGRSERLLAQVNELMGRNEEILSESPVRTVEELSTVEPQSGDAALVDRQAVERFLEGDDE